MPDNTLHPTVSFENPFQPERSASCSRSTSRMRSEIETPHGSRRRPSDNEGPPGNMHENVEVMEDAKLSGRLSQWAAGFGEPKETPHADAVRSLSVSAMYDPLLPANEPDWPTGWRAWICLFGGFLLMFNSWGIVNAYGTFASYYMQHLLPGQDILRLNLVGSTESFVVLALSTPVGRFLDAGYSRTLIITGTILVSLGSFLLTVVNKQGHYGQGNYSFIWLTQGLVTGLGMACFFVTSSQVVATWFKKRKSLAIGMVASGASIAGLVYPMIIKYLIPTLGFNNAARVMAAVVTATSALAIAAATPNPEHIYRKPEKWSFTVFVDVHAFKNASFSWLCAAISILFFGFYAVFFNLEEWAANEGFGYKGEEPIFDVQLNRFPRNDAIRTFYLLSTMNAASTLGRIGAAYFCDIFGALNIHAIVTFVASLLILLLWTMTLTVPAALCFVIFFGIFSGAVIGLPPASVAYILGPDPKQQAKLGQWTGMMYTCAAVFALTGPVIAGHLISEYKNNFLTVQIWSGICLFLSSCCMALAIYYRQRDAKRRFLEKQRSNTESGASTTEMRSVYRHEAKWMKEEKEEV